MSTDRSLSGMADAVRTETSAVNEMTERLRQANRRLTGGTGQAPTPLNSVANSKGATEASVPPLMVGLNAEVDGLQLAISNLRNELSYLENHSETVGQGATEAKSDRHF